VPIPSSPVLVVGVSSLLSCRHLFFATILIHVSRYAHRIGLTFRLLFSRARLVDGPRRTLSSILSRFLYYVGLEASRFHVMVSSSWNEVGFMLLDHCIVHLDFEVKLIIEVEQSSQAMGFSEEGKSVTLARVPSCRVCH
jgi:hypothetical protein